VLLLHVLLPAFGRAAVAPEFGTRSPSPYHFDETSPNAGMGSPSRRSRDNLFIDRGLTGLWQEEASR
jgi:hypothetical protein